MAVRDVKCGNIARAQRPSYTCLERDTIRYWLVVLAVADTRDSFGKPVVIYQWYQENHPTL